MLWLILTIFAYLLLAISALADEALLTGKLLKPKVFAFYVGILSILFVVLIPFGFLVPDIEIIALALLSGFLFIFALLSLYESLRLFEVSRVIPAIGGIMPIFTLGLTFLFIENSIQSFNLKIILSFLLLLLGSILITYSNKKAFFSKSFFLSILTAFLFSLSFFTAKLVYLELDFLPAFIWIKFGSFLTGLFLLSSKEVRKEILKKRKKSLVKRKKTALIFFIGQSLGGLALILQNIAIYLVPPLFLAFVNALEGIRYVFLLILVWIFYSKMPNFLEERPTKAKIIQKVFSIFLIIIGILLLTLN
jgi:drug/metabolite transporter (DMT)-like permease